MQLDFLISSSARFDRSNRILIFSSVSDRGKQKLRRASRQYTKIRIVYCTNKRIILALFTITVY